MAETNRELNVLSESAQIGVILLDPEGKLAFISESAKKLIAADQIKSLDKHLALLKNELSSRIKKLRNKALLEDQIDIELNVGIAKRRLRIELHARSDVDWRGCMLLLRNLSRIDALNSDLRAATRYRGLSSLYAGVTHNLKAPLNAMLLNLELLKQSLEKVRGDAQEDVSARQRHYVEVLAMEIKRLNRLTQSLLDQTAPDSVSMEPMDLARLLDELIAFLKPQVRLQHIDLKVDIESPLYAHGCANEIKYALLNILINGLEAMPEGGTLTVSGECRESLNIVSVCDSGYGIPCALQDKIFAMHFTTKNAKTGTGLYVTRRAIQNHGGTVDVDSSPGEGTCISVQLPVSANERFRR